MNINIIPINGQIFKVCPLHLGLPQPSNEHRTFMKGSEEPATSVHTRENKKWRNPHRVSHPSFWALWIPSLLRVSKALAEEQQFLWKHTCNIKFHLEHHLVGERRVPQQLVGFLHGPILRGNAIDGKDSVSHLQQSTPAVHSGKRGNGKKETRKKRKGGKKTTPQAAMSYFCRANPLQDTQSTDIFCRSGPKEKITPGRAQGRKALWISKVQKYFAPKQPFLVTFFATAKGEKRNPHLSKNQHHGWEMRMINTRECEFLPYSTTNSSFCAPAPSGTQTNGTENCRDSSP